MKKQKPIKHALPTLAIPEASGDAIAVIGIGCIFPDANSPEKYWKNIINRHCAIKEIPKDRWDVDLYYRLDRNKSFMSYSKICAPVKGFEKDPIKFRIPPVSAPFIERIQFLMLEVVHQALEDAGYLKKDFPRERTAVYVGANGKGDMKALYDIRTYWPKFANSFESVNEFDKLPKNLKSTILRQAEIIFKQGMPELSEDTCGGIFESIVASRINNCFNLGGTSLVVDAACASSLAALDMGVKGLRDRQFDLVLAGGVDGNLNIDAFIFFSSLGALSAKGSFPFDERADGFVLGEGAGVVLLKRLDEAMRDSDKIYAIIRSMGTSSDGRAKGITAPDVAGQIRALERAYEKVIFMPDTISLIEAHGTGTWSGDAVEIASLTGFLNRCSKNKRFIGLGSVKSMIGHLKSASGMAGIIKVALALYHKVLPPTINCEYPRKDIDWKNSPFYLITESSSWSTGNLPKRAAVNSFGFGGINYHAVLEEAPSCNKTLVGMIGQDKVGAEFPAQLLIFRAATRGGLLELIKKTKKEVVQSGSSDLGYIAANLLGLTSTSGPILVIVAINADDFISHLDKASKLLLDESRSELFLVQGIYFSERPLGPKEKVAFLFPGSGAQYLHMAGDLPVYFPFMEEIFRKVDSVSSKYIGNSIFPILIPEKNSPAEAKNKLADCLMRSNYHHPLILAFEAGIYELLLRAGIHPDLLAGHSLGEYCALYAAGVFDLETVIDVTTIRGHGIANRCFEDGAMASIGLPSEELSDILKNIPGFVSIANKNCPAQTVISGDLKVLKKIILNLEKKGVLCKLLPVRCAYHTSLLAPCIKPFREFLKTLKIKQPLIPVQSNLSGKFYRMDNNFTANLPDILVNHMVKPVEFISNILSLYKNGARLFIEVGPGSTLSSFVDNILVDYPHWTVQTNLPNRPATLQLLHALAFCIAKGLPVDLNGIISQGRRQAFRSLPKGTNQLSSAVKLTTAILPDPEIITEEISTENTIDDKIKDQIIQLISRKTGYPIDVINIDLDVEAELGLDSIKQVEIIREVTQALNISFGEDLKSQRYKITTIRKLIKACKSLLSKKAIAGQPEFFVNDGAHNHMSGDGWRTNCHRWVSEKVQVPLIANNNGRMLKNRRVLFLAGKDNSGCLLKKYLVEAGATVFVFLPTDKLDSLPADFDLVLNFWSFQEDDIFALEEIKKWWIQMEQRATHLLQIGKRLASSLRINKNKKGFWVEVTSLGGELGEGIINSLPARAGIGLGIMRCLAQEFTGRLEVLCLDFDLQEMGERIEEALFNELKYYSGHSEIGYIGGKRLEIRWKMEDFYNLQSKISLNAQSVVLAIGGAKGITASICRELAEQSHAQFIIAGRSSVRIDNNIQINEPITFDKARSKLIDELRNKNKPIIPAEITRLAWKRVWQQERLWNMRNLSKISENVTYSQCDITDIKSVRQLISQVQNKYGRIDLVIQGVSDLIEKSTEDINSFEFIENMKSKALGTACLLDALSSIEVGAFINLSSVAGRWGNMGQSSYAAGHEVAAILVAGARAKRSGSWINIFFGPWLNVGMIRMGEVMERLRVQGSDFITEKTGSGFFVKELLRGSSRNVAFCGERSVRTLSVQAANLPGQICDILKENPRQKEIQRLLGYDCRFVLAQVQISFVKDILEADKKRLLNEQLSFEEKKRFYSFAHPKRRLEWLAGRIAAKAATRMYFTTDVFPVTAIKIQGLSNVSPRIVIDGADSSVLIPFISISHSKDLAVAVAAQHSGIGIDAQEVTESIIEIAEEFSQPKEYKLINDCVDLSQSLVLTIIWAIKEASRKAVGPHLCTMKELIIKKAKAVGDYIVCELYHLNTGYIKSVGFNSNGYVYAVSMLLDRKD